MNTTVMIKAMTIMSPTDTDTDRMPSARSPRKKSGTRTTTDGVPCPRERRRCSSSDAIRCEEHVSVSTMAPSTMLPIPTAMPASTKLSRLILSRESTDAVRTQTRGMSRDNIRIRRNRPEARAISTTTRAMPTRMARKTCLIDSSICFPESRMISGRSPARSQRAVSSRSRRHRSTRLAEPELSI